MNKVIMAGIDTIDVGYGVSAYNEAVIDFEALAEAKERAQSTDYENEFSGILLNGVYFMVQRTGSRGYDYILINSDITVRICSKAKCGIYFPEIFVSYRSEYLWCNGWRNAIRTVRQWIDGFAQVCYDKVSRLDLCADIEGELPVLDNDLKQISTRARGKTIMTENEVIKKMVFGRRLTGYVAGTGNLMCRIYDKSYEILKTNKLWFNDLWEKNGYSGGASVSRVEFQCRRDFLKDMYIDSTDELEFYIATLWNYLTIKWLRLVDKAKDFNKHRLKILPLWKSAVNAVKKFGEVVPGILRISVTKPKVARLKEQARGIMVTIGALGAVTFSHSAAFVGVETVKGYLKELSEDENLCRDIFRRMHKLNFVPLPY